MVGFDGCSAGSTSEFGQTVWQALTDPAMMSSARPTCSPPDRPGRRRCRSLPRWCLRIPPELQACQHYEKPARTKEDSECTLREPVYRASTRSRVNAAGEWTSWAAYSFVRLGPEEKPSAPQTNKAPTPALARTRKSHALREF